MMACFLVNWKYGWLLAPPALVKHGGDITFVYDMDLKAAGFFLVAAALLAHMFRNLVKVCRSNKNMRRQYEPLIVGIVLLFAGNLAIAIPFFEGFPIDLLCGLLNALALLFALIRRRLFRLRCLLPRDWCYGVGLMFCLYFLPIFRLICKDLCSAIFRRQRGTML